MSKVQLYAKVKRSSKYFHQNEMARTSGLGLPFPVNVMPDIRDSYKVQGGPGGQYRMEDVNLFIIGESGQPFRIK